MKLYIDDVNMDKIVELMDLYPVDGVTSNPTILKKNGKEPIKTLQAIREYIGPDLDLMTQVVSEDAEGMAKEAQVIVEAIGKKNTYVKVPSNPQGMKAIRLIKAVDREILICATGVYTVAQGFLAAQAGADYVAPYVNRIDNLGGDGIQVTKDIQDILNAYDLPCGISSASFKTTRQVIELAKYGVAAAAINVEVWEAFLKNAVVDQAIEVFNNDFADLAGEGKTFLDCE